MHSDDCLGCTDEAATLVAEYLNGVEREAMELPHTDQGRLVNARLAASLVAWYEWSHARD